MNSISVLRTFDVNSAGIPLDLFLHVAHTLGGVGERAFLCGVYMFSPCLLPRVGTLTKKHAGQPGLEPCTGRKYGP